MANLVCRTIHSAVTSFSCERFPKGTNSPCAHAPATDRKPDSCLVPHVGLHRLWRLGAKELD